MPFCARFHDWCVAVPTPNQPWSPVLMMLLRLRLRYCLQALTPRSCATCYLPMCLAWTVSWRRLIGTSSCCRRCDLRPCLGCVHQRGVVSPATRISGSCWTIWMRYAALNRLRAPRVKPLTPPPPVTPPAVARAREAKAGAESTGSEPVLAVELVLVLELVLELVLAVGRCGCGTWSSSWRLSRCVKRTSLPALAWWCVVVSCGYYAHPHSAHVCHANV